MRSVPKTQLTAQPAQALRVGAASTAEAKLNFTLRTRTVRTVCAPATASTYEPSTR